MKIRIFVGAGEPSGDRMLGLLLKELRVRLPDPDIELAGFGGPHCAAQGLASRIPMTRLAVNGVGDVLWRAPFLLSAFRDLRRALIDFRPDLVLLADYPGMNVPLARTALRRGFRVHYLAPPQLWAYRRPEARLRRLRAALAGASLQVLFPFERETYAWAARLCAGHFLGLSDSSPAGSGLLLCPGSRRAALRRNLPAWLNRLGADAEGALVLAPKDLAAAAEAFAAPRGARVVSDPVEVFGRAGRAIAFPGTMTLELFLRRVPTLVWGVLDPLTYRVGRRRLLRPEAALPNLFRGHTLFPEWLGTPRDFARRPPAWPPEWPRIEDEDYAAVAGKIGPASGAEEGVKACLELLEANR